MDADGSNQRNLTHNPTPGLDSYLVTLLKAVAEQLLSICSPASLTTREMTYISDIYSVGSLKLLVENKSRIQTLI